MEFKKVNLDRLPEIVIINYEIFKDMYDWPPYTLDDYTRRLENKDPIIFIAEEKGKIVGSSISYGEGDKFYLWILGVSKEFRGKGVASKLLDLREQYAKENNFKKISTKVYNVSKEMLSLFIKRGYVIVDVKKNDDVKYNAVILELEV